MPRCAIKRTHSEMKQNIEMTPKKVAQVDFQLEFPKDFDHKVLVKILSYVPNRRHAALVNKEWYKAATENDNKEEIYKIHLEENFNDEVRIIDEILKGGDWIQFNRMFLTSAGIHRDHPVNDELKTRVLRVSHRQIPSDGQKAFLDASRDPRQVRQQAAQSRLRPLLNYRQQTRRAAEHRAAHRGPVGDQKPHQAAEPRTPELLHAEP